MKRWSDYFTAIFAGALAANLLTALLLYVVVKMYLGSLFK